jgi:SOUL heme-binding protein
MCVYIYFQISDSSDIAVDTTAENLDTWWFAGYDPPFRVSGRHNEVWVPVVYTTEGGKRETERESARK